MNMKNELQKKIFKTASKLFPKADLKLEDIEVLYPPQQFGDYSCNVAMKLAPKLKKSPMEIASEIVELLNGQVAGDIKEIKVVSPGHINMSLSEEYFRNLIERINEQKSDFGKSDLGKGTKVHLDFVSANPTGPVHLGNGRGGPFGDVLANVLEKTGFQPWREYYVNDFGNQVKVLGHSVLKDDKAEYKGGYIDELGGKIKSKDPFEAGREAAAIILKEMIRPSMEKLGINFNQYFSEKSLHDKGEVKSVFEKLKNEDLVYEKDGALWFRAEKFGDEKDRVIRKSTGEITYFGGDIAYHKNRFERGFDQAIDIWGADHHGDVKRVQGAMQALGYGGKLKIILTQMLKVVQDGKEVKMSKRKGTYISIDDLVEQVGRDAVRFFFLMFSADTHMTFDLNLAKEQSEKNPVYYVQYAHARICSIMKRSEELGVGVEGEEKSLKKLEHPKELELVRHMNRLPELLEEIAGNYEIHRLTQYATTLADKFHSFYGACKVIDEKNPNLTAARLQLVGATRIVLAENLRLLGVSAPEKM